MNKVPPAVYAMIFTTMFVVIGLAMGLLLPFIAFFEKNWGHWPTLVLVAVVFGLAFGLAFGLVKFITNRVRAKKASQRR